MDRSIRLVTVAALFALSCTTLDRAPAGAPAAAAPAATSAPPAGKLPGADSQPAAPQRRHVIRNADLVVEGDDPARARQRAIAVVEQAGGFVLSSDAQGGGLPDGSAALRIDLVLRVPAEAFETALAALRDLGHGVSREQVTGVDVTEEWLDLEAHIRTERALEAQLLEILKSTKAVGEMMEVHGRLAQVRGEIEKMEGRRRFLDDRTSLSTIRLEIVGPAARSGHGIGDSVRRAADDLVSVASGIVTGGIRLVGVLLPVFVMIVLPGVAIGRVVLRRRAARRLLRS